MAQNSITVADALDWIPRGIAIIVGLVLAIFSIIASKSESFSAQVLMCGMVYGSVMLSFSGWEAEISYFFVSLAEFVGLGILSLASDDGETFSSPVIMPVLVIFITCVATEAFLHPVYDMFRNYLCRKNYKEAVDGKFGTFGLSNSSLEASGDSTSDTTSSSGSTEKTYPSQKDPNGFVLIA